MSVENKKLEENRKTVVGFFQKALFEGDVDMAIRLYGGKTYTQHTPFAADGFDGLRNYVKWIAKNYPNTRGEIKRVFADGDYVLLHCHYKRFFGEIPEKILRVPRTQEVSNQLFFIIQSLRFRQCLKVSFAQRIIDWWISQQ
jgi:predicted SnoaL-like aldol condensation-catalyzing enzyme